MNESTRKTRFDLMMDEYDALLRELEIIKSEKDNPESERYKRINSYFSATGESNSDWDRLSQTEKILISVIHVYLSVGLKLDVPPELMQLKPDGVEFLSFDDVKYFYMLGGIDPRDIKFLSEKDDGTLSPLLESVLKSLEQGFGPKLEEKQERAKQISEFMESVLLYKKVKSMPRIELISIYSKLYGPIMPELEDIEEMESDLAALKASYESLRFNPENMDGYKTNKEAIENAKANNAKKLADYNAAQADFSSGIESLSDDYLRSKILSKLDSTAEGKYSLLIGASVAAESPTFITRGEELKELKRAKEEFEELEQRIHELSEAESIVTEIAENDSIKAQKEQIELKEKERHIISEKLWEETKVFPSSSIGGIISEHKTEKLENKGKILDDEIKKLKKALFETTKSLVEAKLEQLSSVDVYISSYDFPHGIRIKNFLFDYLKKDKPYDSIMYALEVIMDERERLEIKKEDCETKITKLSSIVGVPETMSAEELAKVRMEYFDYRKYEESNDREVADLLVDTVTRDPSGAPLEFEIAGDMSDEDFIAKVGNAARAR